MGPLAAPADVLDGGDSWPRPDRVVARLGAAQDSPISTAEVWLAAESITCRGRVAELEDPNFVNRMNAS